MGASGSHKLVHDMEAADDETRFPFEDLPEELLVHILTFVPAKDLVLNLRRVCKAWKTLVDTKSLWLDKCQRDRVCLPPVSAMNTDVQLDLQKMYVLKPFNRNLLQNWDAESGLAGWQVTQNSGHHFKIEPEVPAGANSLHEITDCDVRKCWATSFHWCSKEQLVDLFSCGISPEILDQLQPTIIVSDWVASRWDCGTQFVLEVKLLAANKKTVIDSCNIERREAQWEGKAWNKVEHIFRDYGPGMKYVLFRHKGQDTQFWAGHYGAKIAAPCVKVIFDER